MFRLIYRGEGQEKRRTEEKKTLDLGLIKINNHSMGDFIETGVRISKNSNHSEVERNISQ